MRIFHTFTGKFLLVDKRRRSILRRKTGEAKIMSHSSERLVKNERRNSLAALLRAIKFRSNGNTRSPVTQHFAQPHPRARQLATLPEEHFWVRSAN